MGSCVFYLRDLRENQLRLELTLGRLCQKLVSM